MDEATEDIEREAIERQQEDQHREALQRQNQIIQHLNAQTEALKDSLMRSVEEGVNLKTELRLMQHEVEHLQREIAGYEELMGLKDMVDSSKDA